MRKFIRWPYYTKKKKKLWNCEFFGYEIGKIKEKKKEKGEKKKKKM